MRDRLTATTFAPFSQIGGKVLFGLMYQSQPSLGHVDQQDPATRGNRFICDP